jgi:thioredoxin reductase (NADPH)
MEHYDVIIIGGGPAGFSAGVYTARANLSTIMFEGPQPGGQLTTTTEVENYAGFANGIDGNKLMSEMRDQAVRFGVVDKFEIITSVDFSKQPYVVTSSSGDSYEGKTIIIATGASARYLGLESEERMKGRGVTACATCDGFFYKEKEVIVIGGGDSAMEEATFLTKFASKVTIINRSESFKASPIMYDRANNNPKITILKNKVIEEVLGDKAVTGVMLKDTVTGELAEFPCQGMFLAIGHNPNTALFKGVLEMDEVGYLKTAADSTATQLPGVFAAGDVQDKRYRQAITAAGTGCMAALEAQWYIEKHHE